MTTEDFVSLGTTAGSSLMPLSWKRIVLMSTEMPFNQHAKLQEIKDQSQVLGV